MASSSSSSLDVPIIEHDLFISFRGEDIRTNFLGHLRKELHRNQIDFFLDDEKIHPGDEISSSLLQAIQGSSISLVIFSENYASSTWCLNELVKVIECMKQDKRIVIPVFYKVLPSDVRYQNNSYKEAFDKHQHRFKGDTVKVQSWRIALKETSKLSGFHYPSSKYLDESKFIEEIVKDILEKLSNILSRESKVVVGIDNNFRSIESLLAIESSQVRIIGIWGMGGIGKTTLAEFLFDKYSSQYEGSCMLKNVREESQKSGVPHLFEKLVSELLEGESLHLKGSSKERSTFVQRMLSRKRVFIVLDDMDTVEQFEHLATQRFGPGSRIIVTTRDKHVFRKVHGIYEVTGLSFESSLELFCLNAFDKDYPETGYEEVSKMVVNYANGIPLALKVLGSFLYSKSIEEWESTLAKLKICPNKDIFNFLKLSYDGLDELERELFLDIVFFFKGERKNAVIPFLESCGFFPADGIGNLCRKALISISKYNKIQVHDLIEQMGWEIVRRESSKDPGRRSRLSHHEDVYNVLNNNKGTNSVEGIMSDLSQITRDIHLDADTFKRMPNIRFLKFYYSPGHAYSANVSVSSTLDTFPNELRYLEWRRCPMKSLPRLSCAEKLVELSLPRSHVSKLWDGVQDLVNLKRINLDRCWQLVELPDFTRASNLEEICLFECLSLCELHPSILSIPKLETLNVNGCGKLKSLKGEIHLISLKFLDVCNCSNLKEFSLSSEELASLDFHWTKIDKLHSSVSRLSKLVQFDLYGVRIEALPEELCLLVSLEKLNLEGCKQLIELPQNMKALSRLQHLNIADCCSLRSLPELPPSIIHLSANNCTSLKKIFNTKAVLSLNLVSISFENCVRLDDDDDDDSFLEYVHHPMMGVAIREMLGWMVKRSFTDSKYVYDPTIGDMFTRVFYPGSKVPSWFKYQSGESSVTADLVAEEPHYLDRLVGFILCCVVHHIPSQTKAHREQAPVIQCRIDLWHSKRSAETRGLSSDHVCIWFEQVGGEHRLRDKNVTVKFETYYRSWQLFNWTFIEFKDAWEVIGCGVCPVYASDVLDAFQHVDADFNFFHGERIDAYTDFVEESVSTPDEVKTRLIHKMEEVRKK